MELGVLDHILALILVVLLPVIGVRDHRRLVLAVQQGKKGARLSIYRRTLIEEWGMVALLVAAWLVAGRTTAELGLALEPGTRMWIGWAVALVVSLFLIAQSVFILRSDERMQSLRDEVAPLKAFLPHDDRESRSFAVLAITAGICEELLYRGFLLAYFTSLLGVWPALALSSVAFGLAHSYQGAVGIAKTAVLGLALTGLFLLTGSLWALMILHAVVDLNSGFLGRRAADTWPVTAK